VRNPDWPALALTKLGIPAWLRRRGPLIVMYHGIGGPDGITVGAFERQLTALTRRRQVVPLMDAVKNLGRPESSDLAAITFDDGYRDCAELAVPVLRAKRLQATLFVPAGWLGQQNAWDTERPPRDILSARELRELDPETITIGAHAYTHRRLSQMSTTELRSETTGARRVLEDACGRPVTLYAYPYGQRDDFDAAAEAAVADAGFIAACSTIFGRGGSADERFRLRRVGIEPGDSLTVVEGKFDGAYDWIASKEALGAFGRATLRRRGRAVGTSDHRSG
jgi:peptidoglycan/xylan/chitin deacetylase (PgdA/CDA1 family)